MTDDDEREALAQVIHDSFFAMEAGGTWQEGGYPRQQPNAGDMQLAADILAAGFRRMGPITDAMVKAAREAYEWHSVGVAGMRAALEAARVACAQDHGEGSRDG